MLSQLMIKNLALIDELSLELDPGLNMVTGETGAGKSIVIGAVQTILGARVERGMMRDGAKRCDLQAVFDLADPALVAAVDEILDAAGAPLCDAGQLVLGRTITDKTTRNFANASAVTAQTLRAIGDLLVDVHGPYDHQSLLRPARQLSVLDAYAGAAKARAALDAGWARLRAAREALAAAEAEVPSPETIDVLRYQVKEITRAAITEEEEVEVNARHAVAANAQEVLGILNDARDLATEGDAAIVDQLRSLNRVIDSLDHIDSEACARFGALVESGIAEIQTLADEIESYVDRIDVNPGTFDEMEARLGTYQRLKRKYGGTVTSALAYAEEAAGKLARLENHGLHCETLRQEVTTIEAEVLAAAKTLSNKRHKSASGLAKQVVAKLHHLGFPKSRFGIDISDTELGPSGIDVVEFMFCPNPGEADRPLRQIASSGEISRVMLALKTVLAEADDIPVLIFDEVDANIGGRVAVQVGSELRALSAGRQVICITHQPQVAAGAHRHFLVEKQVKRKRTTTTLTPLSEDERVAELARMLGATHDSSAAMHHARELIAQLQ